MSPTITLEFGGRATGEPNQVLPVTCDMDGYLKDVSFPTARPVVMSITRTFWEKATAAHVYCMQGRLRGRFARHWHDLAAIAASTHGQDAIRNQAVALAVAHHKSMFFPEKDDTGQTIDYADAAQGQLRIVPEGKPRDALMTDYAAMQEDQMLLKNPLPFDELMELCDGIEEQANSAHEKK